MSLNTFCSHCGLKFAEQKTYPRKCFHCGNDTYRNPIPVAVGIIPVLTDNEIGILVLQRGNEPGFKEWGMPGGYLEYGETWQEGLSREVKETLDKSATKLGLSARAYHRVIKLARTIADLENKKEIEHSHILEALQYRPKVN
jgi:NADH pyrophosphatase NudC (nudix superfamily)